MPPTNPYDVALAQNYISNLTPHAGGNALQDKMRRQLQTQLLQQQHAQAQQQIGGVPDLSQLSAQATAATDPSFLNNLFDVSAGNLMQRGAQQAGMARQGAGAQAASRGFLNPTAFINAAGSRAQAPFTGQFGMLEAAENRGTLHDAYVQICGLDGERDECPLDDEAIFAIQQRYQELDAAMQAAEAEPSPEAAKMKQWTLGQCRKAIKKAMTNGTITDWLKRANQNRSIPSDKFQELKKLAITRRDELGLF